MNRRLCLTAVGAAALVALTGSLSLAQDAKTKKAPPTAAAGQELQLPPGWTEEDMMVCMEAAMPGPMHEHLTAVVGVWHGKSRMWMAPGVEPIASECVSTITPMFDGRYTKCEMSGDWPGMGPYNGFAIYGFDNVSQKFQSTWVDNCGTGMAIGTGELSSDGTLTWTFTYNCPLTNKPVTMREIERRPSPDTMTLEMHGTDPKTGVEFKMMEIAFTRKATTKVTATGGTGR